MEIDTLGTGEAEFEESEKWVVGRRVNISKTILWALNMAGDEEQRQNLSVT